MTPAPKLTPTEKAAKALAQLSDAEWLSSGAPRSGGAPISTRFGIWPKNFANFAIGSRRDDHGSDLSG
jgi:hypothetical protein